MAWMRSGVRSPSAPLITLFTVLVFAGCNTSSPVKDAPRDLADAASPVVGVNARDAASPGASAQAPAQAGCSSDADCRTWSSYCKDAPCVCRVLAKGEADPSCASPGNVACFADPCMNKTAACQGGRCVLVMGSKD